MGVTAISKSKLNENMVVTGRYRYFYSLAVYFYYFKTDLYCLIRKVANNDNNLSINDLSNL